MLSLCIHHSVPQWVPTSEEEVALASYRMAFREAKSRSPSLVVLLSSQLFILAFSTFLMWSLVALRLLLLLPLRPPMLLMITFLSITLIILNTFSIFFYCYLIRSSASSYSKIKYSHKALQNGNWLKSRLAQLCQPSLPPMHCHKPCLLSSLYGFLFNILMVENNPIYATIGLSNLLNPMIVCIKLC